MVVNAIHSDNKTAETAAGVVDSATVDCEVGENCVCFDSNSPVHPHHHQHHESGAIARTGSVYSDCDSDEDLTDDYDPDELRESEVNEILADRESIKSTGSSHRSGSTTKRISFSVPQWGTLFDVLIMCCGGIDNVSLLLILFYAVYVVCVSFEWLTTIYNNSSTQ